MKSLWVDGEHTEGRDSRMELLEHLQRWALPVATLLDLAAALRAVGPDMTAYDDDAQLLAAAEVERVGGPRMRLAFLRPAVDRVIS